MLRSSALLALAAAIVTAPASATESTIYPGVGIGKVRLGMTQAQVVRALGKDYVVNSTATVGGAAYRELAWNFASWSVGFLRAGSTWRVVQVETTVRPQRTATNVGVGSPFIQVVQKEPAVFCGGIDPTYGSPSGPGGGSNALILVSKGPVYTAFAVQPVEPRDYGGAWRVFEAIVQRAIPGHRSLWRTPQGDPYRCRDGWRERGTP
jgi:hypothetical protein